jgi:protein TonB
MLRPRLSHYLVISLALHAGVFFMAHNNQPQRSWLAGPVIVRLVPAARSTRESHPTSTKKSAPAVNTQHAATMRPATAAEKILPQHRLAKTPAAAENLANTNTPTEPGQRQTAETATRKAEREQQLLDSLHAALVPHFSYPLLARRRGWEGVVRVGLRIEANGRLTRLHLVEPSPYDVLNTAAIKSLSNLARLPDAGLWLQDSHVDLVLPVEYRLLEG